MPERKTLQEKFLNGEKLSILDNLRINLLQGMSECDGMCGFNSACESCQIYKDNYFQNKPKYKTN